MNESDIKKPAMAKTAKHGSFNQTFESSILDRQEKFMFDKTLVQGIKENDSSKIVENSQERDLGSANQLYDEKKEVHEMFVSTRKDFDKTKQIVNKIQSNLDRLKKEKEMLATEKTNIQASFTGQQREFKNIQTELQKLNAMCEVADYQKEIRLQMGQVLRQDILYYKKNCFEANGKILRNHNKLRTLNGQFQSTRKVSSNCRSLIYSIEKKINEKQTQRIDKISSYHEIINRKMENNIKRQERQRMIEESMLEALNGKMPEQQEQKKLLLSNLVLKRMLKLKMQRQMERFNEIQTTFRKIKQHTTVKKADQFVDKFIKRQKNYGQLLDSISKNEDKINILKQQNERLEKQLNENMFVKQSIQDQENQKKSDANKSINLSIEILREKLLRNEFLKNKVLSFASKFVAGFDQSSIEEVKEKLSRQQPQLSLKQVLLKVNSFLDTVSKEEEESKLKEIYIESKNLALPETVKVRNLRIKTISTHGDQNQNSAMENYDVAYDDVSQKQFLNQNRKQIKKSAYLRNRMKTRAY